MKRSLRSWLWRVPIEHEIDEELALHIEMRTRELVERGMDPKTARELAHQPTRRHRRASNGRWPTSAEREIVKCASPSGSKNCGTI